MATSTDKHLQVVEDLVKLVKLHPTARVVTDVGASMLSGWGDLESVEYHADVNAIELNFN